MVMQKIAGLIGKVWSRQQTRRTRSTKPIARRLGFLCLEDRRMLAGILGTAEGFAVLAGSTVTNTGPSIISGNVGLSPGTAIVGFPPGIVIPPGVIHATDAVALQAQSDVVIAYNDLAGRASDFDLTGQDLGGLTLVPGVYTFSSSAQLTGMLTLDGQGDPDAEFIFQIGSMLTTASASSVIMINGADSCDVYWQVGSSATLGTGTDFVGSIVALTSITLTTEASILNGRALARNGAVTLDSNEISIDGCGDIAWEKRDEAGTLLGGAVFTITPDPTDGIGILTIVDNGPGDADPALGQFLVDGALFGTYTVTETAAPLGYAIDADPTRVIVVTPAEMHPTIGVQGTDDAGVTDESDFHNSLLPIEVGSIAWEKRDASGVLLGGAIFTITPDPLDGVGILTILDNGPGDADPALGQILVLNTLPGTYTVTETTAPLGYVLDTDATRVVIVTVGGLTQVIGVQGTDDAGVTDESDFHNRRSNVIIIGPGKSPQTPQQVTVIDESSGEILVQFAPFGTTFQGGVRVAAGDLTGDGIDEIIVASGPSIAGEVRVYSQSGDLLTSFLPYGSTYVGGVQIAVGDIDGDGLLDIITVPSAGRAEVKVFRNVLVVGAPTFDAANPYRDFLAFPASFIGGAVVAVADMGSTPLVNGPFGNTLDQKAEIVIGSSAGMQATVKVFDVSGMATSTPNTVPAHVRSFTPFTTSTRIYKGGVSLSVARINADLVPDIVVGAGVNGGSLVDVWGWSNTPSATLASLSANGLGFAAFTGTSQTAAVQVATMDTNGDAIADVILAAQGPSGITGQINEFDIISTAPLQVSLATAVPGTYPGPSYIATIVSPILPVEANLAANIQSSSAPLEVVPPATRFYVVNDDSANRTYEYGENGEANENYTLSSANTAPRGAVSTAAGDKVWVIDANRKVFVYDASGNLLGNWTAGTLASNATVEGIATNGTDIWIVDAQSDKVYRYTNAASRLSGSQNSASSFMLSSGNTSPKDIVTDGTHLWVVNDAAEDKVFKYTMSGALVGSWAITGGGGGPTGITLDPAAPSHLWIVDSNADRVYQYDSATGRTSGSQASSISFALEAGNTNPQGIADPPVNWSSSNDSTSYAAKQGAVQDTALLALLLEMDWTNSTRRKSAELDSSADASRTSLAALLPAGF